MAVEESLRSSVVVNQHRWFILMQIMISTLVFLLCKALLLTVFVFVPESLRPFSYRLNIYTIFQLSLILYSRGINIIASPHPDRPASASELLHNISVFLPGGHPMSPDFLRRVQISLTIVFYVTVSPFLALYLVACVTWSSYSFPEPKLTHFLFGTLGFRSFALGFFYCLHYVYNRRWVLHFPNHEEVDGWFFRFTTQIPSAIGQAIKLSSAAYLISIVLERLPSSDSEYTSQVTIADQNVFCIGVFVVFFCWELSHHLYQVLHTKRMIFAPPKGSADAETNPSEPLLSVLEDSQPKSPLQYFAYLDLYKVCEYDFDAWRRAAFFEKTGTTYKRVVAVCLRPLEQFTVKLGEVLESCTPESSFGISHQLHSPTEQLAYSRLNDILNDFQLCTWSAQSAASLIVHAHKENQFRADRCFDSNAAIMSTLVSSLLAVETLMGKETNLQPPSNTSIGLASLQNGMNDPERKDNLIYSKADSMAKIFRTSIYRIVFALQDERLNTPNFMAKIFRTSIYLIMPAFQDERLNSSNIRLLQDWIIKSKPLYGTHELHWQKLRTFL